MAIKVTESYPVEFVSHVSDSLLLIGIHVNYVIAPLSRLAMKRADWPVSPISTSAKKRFHVQQPTFLFPLETPLRLSRNMLHGGKTIFNACQIPHSMYPSIFNSFPVIRTAIFTYCSSHFCFPWRRPYDYHPTCSMDGKPIQCLPNPSQHVPIYFQ